MKKSELRAMIKEELQRNQANEYFRYLMAIGKLAREIDPDHVNRVASLGTPDEQLNYLKKAAPKIKKHFKLMREMMDKLEKAL